MNGWELAREALELRPGLKVLFTYGFPGAACESQASSSLVPEGHLLLSMPYRKPELAQKLREALAVYSFWRLSGDASRSARLFNSC